MESASGMSNIRSNLLVMSGKGGVGKTTVAVNLAYALSEKGLNTGLLDVDIHGPNVPKMLGLENNKVATTNNKLIPVDARKNLKVMSIAFLIEKWKAVIWRGPLKHNIIRQFIEDVQWGDLDFLIVDFPPGTGDEAISISQLLKGRNSSIMVATPQDVALADAAKAIDFSRKVNIPIIGIIENMSGSVFGEGNVKDFAEKEGIKFLGSIGMGREIVVSGDNGIPFVSDKSLKASMEFLGIVKKIEESCKIES
ncbi:Mrp/NBP35 family ATP-binding protein [Candidatus Woesearchaeota archaeon]|nr:Mrp/NBP35 family ATP-binding protein [Candidatus Woesearchaeota archaeon]